MHCISHLSIIINIPPLMLKWIIKCISTVTYGITINGSISECWKPTRGIKQGDPLFPYIFIICMNLLILEFLRGHKIGEFNGMQINKNTPLIPILCFADDCIIFCKNNKKSLDFLRNTIAKFEKEAGLGINWNKTKAYFSKNTPKQKIRETCNDLNIKIGNRD